MHILGGPKGSGQEAKGNRGDWLNLAYIKKKKKLIYGPNKTIAGDIRD